MEQAIEKNPSNYGIFRFFLHKWEFEFSTSCGKLCVEFFRFSTKILTKKREMIHKSHQNPIEIFVRFTS